MTSCHSRLVFLAGILLIIPILFIPASAWQNALCSIMILGQSDSIQCHSMHDSFTLAAGNNISLNLDNQTNTVTISSIPQDPLTIPGKTLVASGEVTGFGLIIHDIVPGDTIFISFKGDYTAVSPVYQTASLSVNNVIVDTSGFAVPENTTIPFTLIDHYTVIGGEDIIVSVTSDAILNNGKITWSQYR